MLVPSINIMGGRAVQLAGGVEPVLDAGEAGPLLARFSRVGMVQVVDVDALLGRGDNAALITAHLPAGSYRIGGGIRTLAQARRWLDAGAAQVVIGTAADPAMLVELPCERVIAALDARDGEVVVEGWRRRTGQSVAARMAALRGLVGGFLVTFVENEGGMRGPRLEQIHGLLQAAGSARLTVAGGISTTEEIAALDRMGVDAQVGMALYDGRLELAEGLLAPMATDRMDGLFPAVVTDEGGVALSLVYASAESVRASLEEGVGVFHSRQHGLWRAKEGRAAEGRALMPLVRVDLDCDRDALRFVLRHSGAFCAQGDQSCFGAGWRGQISAVRYRTERGVGVG